MFFWKKNKAMSYVELVLVLTIIGVIASLTLPALKKHSQRTELGELAKKAYSTIEDAMDNAILEKGPMRNWDFSSNQTFFNEYVVPNINNTSIDAGNVTLVTNDGSRITIAECNGSMCHFHVDVNNTKGPNLTGKDNFEFQVNKATENVVPHSFGGADELARNRWKFTDELWDKTW